MVRIARSTFAVCLLLLALAPARAYAQADEIQVYDGGLAPVGTVNLTIHNNFTPKGLTTPAFPGAVVADKSFNGVPEWALGVTSWFEAGLYLPLYSRDKHSGFGYDGFKLRALFAVPNADDRRFFYGANFEFSINARRWDSTRFTSEVRPIIGWHLKPWDIIVNPIVDTAYDGLGNLEFVPAARVLQLPVGAGAGGRGVRRLRHVQRLRRPRRSGPPALWRRRPHLEGLGHRGGGRRRPHRRLGSPDLQADSRPGSQPAPLDGPDLPFSAIIPPDFPRPVRFVRPQP